MESTGLTGMTPYEEMTRHFPIIRGIFDCLTVEDLMTARLIGPSWDKFITDLLHKMEGDLMSPLSPIDLTNRATLRHFLVQFPVECPPLGLKLFQFANIKLSTGTPMAELTPFLTTHGKYIKFLTIGIHTTTDPADEIRILESIKFILRNCPGIATLCTQRGTTEMSQHAPVIVYNLTGWEFRSKANQTGTSRFLEDGQTPGTPNSRIMEGEFMMLLDLNLEGFKSLMSLNHDFKIPKLHLRLLAEEPFSDEDQRILTEGIAKFDDTLQELKIWTHRVGRNPFDINDLRIRLPPTLSIQKLNLNTLLDSPIIPSQVPNLEQVEIPSWVFEEVRENPFALGSVFPKVHALKLRMDRHAVSWKFGFPNLETLWMKLPVRALGTLGTFLSQFPTLGNLFLMFRSESSDPYRREAWWDLFTGGIRPLMTRTTSEDVILGKVPSVTQNPIVPLLQVLPTLKRLKLVECPEVIACAVVHLTATERIQRLDILEIETTCPQIKCYLDTLTGYHKLVTVSITGHFPIMRAIFDCLPGRELMSARLLDSTWNKFITDLIRKQEAVWLSPLRHVDLTDLETLRYFLTQFPEGLPPLGLKLFQFSGLNLYAAGTRLPELTQMITIHGEYIKFLTLSIPTVENQLAGNPSYETIRLILNNCPTIEKLCLQDSKMRSHQPHAQIQGVRVTQLQLIPKLEVLETECESNLDVEHLEFLHDIVRKAPKLGMIKGITVGEVEGATIFEFLQSSKDVLQTQFTILLDFTSPGINALLNGIREVQFRILGLTLEILVENPVSDEAKNTIAEALGKLDNLQVLEIMCRHTGGNGVIRLRLPPLLNMSYLIINSFLESPIMESQVPNLEQVQIPAFGFQYDRENPFCSRSVFPKMKHLLIVLNNQAATWKFGFSNLKTLSIRFPPEAIRTLGTFLAQFPTVVNLNLEFGPESSRKSLREAWWNVFTGGSRPVMTHTTSEDAILGKIPAVTQNSTAPLLQGLPSLKRLTVTECPEVIAYAIVNLTTTGEMQQLKALEFDTKFPEIHSYFATLQRYHARVKISTLP